jgi:uncharacterized protein (DUF1778 family)
MRQKDEHALRDELDSLKDTDRELEGFQRIESQSKPTPRAVFSMRIGRNELEEIEAASHLVGKNMGEFIRDAALQHARLVVGGSKAIAEINLAARALIDGMHTLGIFDNTPLPHGLVVDEALTALLEQEIDASSRRILEKEREAS